MQRSIGTAVLLVFFALLASACSTHLPAKGISAFHHCQFDEAVEVFRSKGSSASKKDLVLYDLAILSSAFSSGDDEEAKKAAIRALDTMWSDAGKGRGRASLVSSEALKIFKGEPFEKAMTAIYVGVIFFNQGDFENARAAFSKAVLAIKTKEIEHENDFALAHALLAWTYIQLDEKDNARISLKNASERFSEGRHLGLERWENANALFIVELGHAPAKRRTGPGQSLVDWRRVRYPERFAKIFRDGTLVGRTSLLGDLTYQAKTKGWTGKDTVQVTKGVARDAATITAAIAANKAIRDGDKTAGWVALGTGLFALANQSQADIRQWELLPDLIHALPARLPRGKQDLSARYYGQGGRSLRSLDQSWIFEKSNKPHIFWLKSNGCQPRDTYMKSEEMK